MLREKEVQSCQSSKGILEQIGYHGRGYVSPSAVEFENMKFKLFNALMRDEFRFSQVISFRRQYIVALLKQFHPTHKEFCPVRTNTHQ